MNVPNEILQDIFNIECDDITTLHSCLLVNKKFCINVIPILWEKPYHLLSTSQKDQKENYSKLLSTLVSAMFSLIEFEYTIELSTTTFEYYRYLRELAYYSLYFYVEDWCWRNGSRKLESIRKIFYNILYILADNLKLETLIFEIEIWNILYKSLFHINYISELSKIFLNRKIIDWISNIKYIEFNGDFNLDANLHLIINNLKNIRKMIVCLPLPLNFDNDEQYNSSAEMIAQIIKSQRKLEYFSLRNCHYSVAIGNALRYQSNFLKSIEFLGIVFDATYSFDWLELSQFCNNLKSLVFKDSCGTHPFISHSIIQSPLQKLVSLIFEEYPIPLNTLETLIISCNVNLKEIVFGKPNHYECCYSILKLISIYCPNLIKLGANIGPIEVGELLTLESCKKLKFLDIYGNGDLFNVDYILPELGLKLPASLREFNIRECWRFSSFYLSRFLGNSKVIKFCFDNCEFVTDDFNELFEVTLKDRILCLIRK